MYCFVFISIKSLNKTKGIFIVFTYQRVLEWHVCYRSTRPASVSCSCFRSLHHRRLWWAAPSLCSTLSCLSSVWRSSYRNDDLLRWEVVMLFSFDNAIFRWSRDICQVIDTRSEWYIRTWLYWVNWVLIKFFSRISRQHKKLIQEHYNMYIIQKQVTWNILPAF